jgi:demethylmenaquinone methyltransferase/2-methoxy-6-polyprenyl-1,4-benzoquinol methylase
MLSLAQRRYGNVRWQQSSAEKLPFLDGSFDAVISAYVMRNLYRGGILPQTLSEARRVLTPTGKLVFLDLTQPVGGFLRWGHRLYNQTVLPLLGRLFFGDRWPKHYLASSIEALPSVDKLREFFLSSGFKSFEFRPLWGGIVSLFIGSRQ